MKKLIPTLATITALATSLATVPVFARGPATEIPEAAAVVTLKDFDFFSTFQNPVGVAVDSKGDILIGILFTGEILKVTPEGKVSHFTQLPVVNPVPESCPLRPDPPFPARTAFMTGFALHGSGDLYVGLPTCDPKTHGIWRVSRDGSRKELFASLPVEDLPKGLAFSKDSEFPLYVTDLHDFREEKSRANCLGPEDKGGPGPNYPCILKVWRIDHHGNVDDWIESTLFYGNPESPLDHPHGVNGIVVDDKGKNVYVTVTDFGRVVKIPVKRDGSAGKPKLFFEENNPPPNPEERDLFGMDGITIGPDGNFYIVVVRTDQLVVIPPNGKSYTIVVEGHPLDGPTQLAFGKDTKDWDFAFGRGKAGKGSQSLPPLYITSGSGRRIFFYNIANALGEGNIIDGVLELLNLGVINEQEAIGLNPRPALVEVLLEKERSRR